MRSDSVPLKVPALAWLVVPIAWLLARPYRGIRHDATLYMGQALNRIWPDIFSNDVFFRHGSQDSYSVFAAFAAWLFKTLGVVPVEALVPLCAQLGLLALAYWLVRVDGGVSRFEAWLALVALAAFPHLYEGISTLAFAEPFLTARTVAEPLCLLAMCALLAQRWVLFGAAMTCAGLTHPLLTLPVVIVSWIYLSFSDRRWLWASTFLLLPVLLGLLGYAPFDKLFLRYDALWWSNVEERNPMVLLSSWKDLGWQTVVFDVSLLALAPLLIRGRLGGLCRATTVAALLMLIMSAIGADLLHNVLLTSLQLWRVMWWVHLLALLILPVLVIRFAKLNPHGLMVAAALLAASIATRWSGGWVIGIWAALSLGIFWRQYPISQPFRLAAIGINLFAACAICIVIGLTGAEASSLMDGATYLSTAIAFLTTPVAVLAIALALFWVSTLSNRYQVVSCAVMLLAGGIAVLNWDRRDDWQRFVESSLDQSHPFQRLIGSSQQVYWHEQLQASWLVLKRPNYYSEVQGAGQLFNRGTMEEMSRRSTQFKGLRLQEYLCGVMGGLSGTVPDQTCSPTLDVLEEICSKQTELSFMVFDVKLLRGVVDEWTFSPASGRKPKTFYLYDCNKLRSA